MLLDLTLSDLKGKNLDRTNFSPYMCRVAKLTPMFSWKNVLGPQCEVFDSAITFICPK